MLRAVPAEEREEAPAAPLGLEHVSTQLSELLADLVRAQERALPAAFTPELAAGGTVGRFTLLRELGRGGFGVVFEARDAELSRTVALKVVRPGTRIAARSTHWLLREAEAVARLNHPNIITLHDFGQGPSGPYLVFELLRGRSLAVRLKEGGPLPAGEAIDLGLAIARALVHAHAAGVIHRDLTAGNVHLGEDGAVKVLDFGLAHLFGRDGANDGGTPAYMAPEQWEGSEVGERCDLFALGVILFQALTGRFPYQVEKGWSEALEPGPTPQLPRGAAPRRVRRLVRALLERDPELRPDGARQVRDELLAVRSARDGARRRRGTWALGAVATAAVALSAWLSTHREPPPGEQVPVVLAALENGAGEPTLEAVPGLLAAALAPSQRVKVVPAARLAYAARQAGLGDLGDLGRLDADRARSVARLAGAPVVLLPSAWLEDGAAVVGVRAIESETGKQLFGARGAPGEGRTLAAVIDQLSDQVRRELNERSADRRLRRPVAELVTASPEAARWYYQGVDCLHTRIAANGNSRQCVRDFERALALDPTFPLAHYQLASLYLLPGDSGELARPHAEAALRLRERLPAREAQLLQALAHKLEGRTREALALYDALLAASPDDPELLVLASDAQIDQGDWEDAARYLEKLWSVAPAREETLLALVEALGRLNRLERLGDLLRQLEQERPRRWDAVVEANLWLARPVEAVQAAREAAAEQGAPALKTLVYALLAVGDFREAEAACRERLRASPGLPAARRELETALLGQGRVDEALRWSVATAALLPQPLVVQEVYRQALIAAALGDPRRLWPYAARTAALDAGLAADLAVVLELQGDAAHAALLERGLRPGSSAAEQLRAVRRWRAADPAGAAAQLVHLEAADPWPIQGLAPSYLLAEVLASMHDAPGTLAAVERFHRMPADRLWRAWAFPRSLYLAASAHAALGERALALQDLGRLLRTLADADASLPLLRDARALARTLDPVDPPAARR